MDRAARYFTFLIYPVIISLVLLGVPLPGFAQENLTITTYYPSPAGSYNEMTVQSFLYVGNNCTIRLGSPASFVDLMTFATGPNRIQFHVPVNVTGDITANNITAQNNLTVANTLTANGINVATALRQLRDFNNAQTVWEGVQNGYIAIICGAVAVIVPPVGVAIVLLVGGLGAAALSAFLPVPPVF